ncbi:aminotransferase class III-fold pyridoxal phosphate-dependent enzyme [Planctomycetota bacterium]
MPRSVSKSWDTFTDLKGYLAGGSSTNSKRPEFEDAEPALIVRGKGCRVWDLDGNEYIDFRNALGPVTLGYTIEEINNAVIDQLKQGIIFGHPHPLEGEVAKMLTEVLPCAERARFLKTGGEAIAATIKIARNATQRNKIIQSGYNGWLNTLSMPKGTQPRGVSSAQPLKGVPQEISNLHMSLPWGDLEEWENVFFEQGEDIAAAVIACSAADMKQGYEFLPAVRALTEQYGTLLIMDEIVTGFRLAIGGAHEYFDIMPDMAVFGKGLANGMPIAAYTGKGELLDSAPDIGITSTFGGETLSLAASKAAIEFYKQNNVIDYLWEAGESLWNSTQKLGEEHDIPIEFKGVPVCPVISFEKQELRNMFFKLSYQNGISLYDVPYINFSHKESDIEETLERFEKVFQGLG